MRARYFRGTKVTTKHLTQLLPSVLARATKSYQGRADVVCAAWETIIGAKLAKQTVARSFQDGVLFVSVKNSTLYSLLSQHDKPRIVQKLRENFPHTTIKTVVFRLE